MKLKRILFILLIMIMPFIVNAQESFEITDIHVVEQSGTITIADLSYENNNISSNIIFNQVDDFVTLDVEMKNNTNIDYALASVSNQFNNDNIVIDSESIGKKIIKKDIQQYRVTLKYGKELINENDKVLENVNLSFNFVDSTTLINPRTFNNIFFLIVCLLLVSGITFALYKKKKGLLLVPIIVLILPFLVRAEAGTKVDINFNRLEVKARMLHYNVIVDDGNGNTQILDREYGSTIDELGVPEKEGYNYDYWVDQNNQEVDNDSTVTEDMTISPHFTPIVYSISYDLNGGTLVSANPESYTIEDDITLNNPSIVGYTFKGWSSDGGVTFQTSIHLVNSVGNKSYTAYYSANQDTLYTVIHRQMDMNGEYQETEREELHGATDTPVTPEVRTYTGFTSPESQTKNINGDGSTTFTFDYVRNQYTFSISDRTYINSYTTINGTYYYGTTITISALNRAGYTFSWSDGSTDNDRTFIISSDMNLSAVYTPRTDTAYTVIHKKMDLNGSTYTEADRQDLTGTTDTNVTPAVNTYEGFTAPSTQTVRIDGDGSRVVEYLYTRNKYTLTLEDSNYIETSFTSGTKYYYDTEITLEAKTRDGFTFSKWSNESTSNPVTFHITRDITMKPIYDAEGLSFATSSWDEIIEAYNSGNTESLEADMEAGTTRDIDMGDLGTHKLRIANLSTPDECKTDGFSQTACGFVVEFADIITSHNMNSTNTNVGGWPASEMYSFIQNDIYSALPSDIKNKIIDTVVVSGHGSKSGETNFISTDKLYLLSSRELWGENDNYDSSSSKSRQFDYYAGLGVTKSNTTGALKNNSSHSGVTWWLRSGYIASTTYFYNVNIYGNSGITGSSSNSGVSPAFRIASKEVNFATSSWDDIVSAYNSGNTDSLEEAMNAGTTRDVPLDLNLDGEIDDTNDSICKLRIANLSTPEECSTTGFSQTACGLVLECSNVIATHVMNSPDSNVGGWRDSQMRTYLNSSTNGNASIYNALPSDLKPYIMPTLVVSGIGCDNDFNWNTYTCPTGETSVTSYDNIYLFSSMEVFGNSRSYYDTARFNSRQLDYYSSKGTNNTNYAPALKRYNNSASTWYFRNAYAPSNNRFNSMRSNGEPYAPFSTNEDGVSPAFRISQPNK